MKTKLSLFSVGLFVASGVLLTAQTAPAIVNHPLAQSVTIGASVALTVTATGTTPFNYQWRKNGGAIAGATSDTLALPPFNDGAAAVYDVIVQNATGSATSAGALLTVRRPAAPFPVATTAGPEFATGAAYGGGVCLVGIKGDATSSQNATAQLVAAEGSLIGARIVLGAGGGMGPVAAHDGTNFLVVWDQGGTTLFGQLLSSAGARIGGPIAVANVDPKSYRVAYGGGKYLVCWTVDGAVYGQLVLPEGATTGSRFAIGGATANAGDCAVAFNGANFLVAWCGGPGNFRPIIYGQLVSPAGALVGGTLMIDESTPPSDNPMAVASNGTDFFVIWHDEVGALDAGEWDLFGRMVTGAGVVQPTRLAIATIPGAQQFPSLGFDGTNYLAMWIESAFSSNARPVFRFFSPAGQPVGPEFTIFSAVAGNAPLFGGVAFGGTRYLAFASYGTWPLGGQPVFNDVSGAFVPASWGVYTAPQITTQPASQTAYIGGGAMLKVVATGSPGPLYQWRKGGAAIDGATDDTLVLSNLGAPHAGSYDVVITNGADSVTSTAATLTVSAAGAAPAITSVTPGAGEAGYGNFNVSVTTTVTNLPPSYQWYEGARGDTTNAIAGATGDFHHVSAPLASSRYWLRVTDRAGLTADSPTIPALAWERLSPEPGFAIITAFAASNSAIVGAAGTSIERSTDGIHWSVVSRADPPVYGLAFFGNRFIGVGSSGKTVTSTDDGLTWTSSSSGVAGNSNDLNAMAVGTVGGNPRLVAVGKSSTVVSTDDGTNWTLRSLGATGIDLSSVAFGGGKFVAVGVGGRIFSSPDAVTWTTQVSPTANDLRAVAQNGGFFVAVGNSGTLITSPDGTIWTQRSVGMTSMLFGVAYVNGRFMTGGSANIIVSTDGLSWTTSSPPVWSAQFAFAYFNNLYVATGFPGAIFTSPDATNWTLRYALTTQNLRDVAYGNGVSLTVGDYGTGVLVPDGGSAVLSVPPPTGSASFYGITYASGTFAAVGNNGTIATTPDGIVWTKRTSGTSSQLNSIASGGGKFLAVGTSGVTCLSSDLGATWTAGTVTGAGTTPFNGIAYSPIANKFVAIGGGGAIYIYDPSAAVWSAATGNPTTQTLNRVRFLNGKFIAVGAGSTILSSVDGLSWSAGSVNVASVNLVDVSFGEGIYLALHADAARSSNAVYISLDGTSWQEITANGNLFLFGAPGGSAVAYANGRFVVGSRAGGVVRSVPRVDLPRILTHPPSQVFAAGQSRTFSVTTTGAGLAYQWYQGASGDTTAAIAGSTSASYTTPVLSAPARYWVRVTLPDGGVLDSATAEVFGPPLITTQPQPQVTYPGAAVEFAAGVSAGGAVTLQWYRGTSGDISSPVAGATTTRLAVTTGETPEKFWLRVSNAAGTSDSTTAALLPLALRHPWIHLHSFKAIAYGSGLYIAASDGARIYSSPDGVAWTLRYGPAGSSWRAATYGGGKFVVVGDSGMIRTSADGLTWAQPSSGTSNHLLGVIHDGSQFVAVGASSTVLVSADGNTWSGKTLGTSGLTLNGVAYGNGTYVAVASTGAIYTTADNTLASTWAAATSGTTNGLNGVACLNGKFFAVGNSGTIRSSTSGTGTWTSVTSGTTTTLYSAAYSGSLYVIHGGNTVLTSSDGSTWSSSSFISTSAATVFSLLYANSRFVAVGYPGLVFTSPTGAADTWSMRSGVTTSSLADVAYGNGRFVAVGSGGAVVTSPDGAAWSSKVPFLPGYQSTTLRRIIYAQGQFVLSGDGGLIATSTDAGTWTNRSFGTTSYTALAYGGGKLVAAGAGGAYAVSTDASLWTAGTGTIGTATIGGLAYGSGVFVAVNSAGGIYSSSDGVTWIAQSSGTTNALNHVRYVNGQFIAVGANSTLLTSSNATAWTSRTVNLAGLNLTDVAYLNGVYLAVHSTSAQRRVLVISVDGATWDYATADVLMNLASAAGITCGNGTLVFASDVSAITQTLPAAEATRILVQPVGSDVSAGAPAVLSVNATGSGLSYQWYRGASGDTSTPMAGGTSATYTTPGDQQVARYWVRVSGSGGSVDSGAAAVGSAAAEPVLTKQPISLSITAGQPAAFSVTATGTGTLAYQWRRDGVAIPGATGATLSLAAATRVDAGDYNVVVTDNWSKTATSATAKLRVAPVTYMQGARVDAAFAHVFERSGATISRILVQSDGKVVVAGDFTSINGSSRVRLVRLDAAGVLDASFTPPLLNATVNALAQQPGDQKLLVGGAFVAAGGTPQCNRVVRLNPDGSLDPTFNPAGAGPNSTVNAVVALPGGKILIGGSFSMYNGIGAAYLARLNADGTFDASFAGSASTTVNALAVQSDGQILIGGSFTTASGVSRNRVARLNADGTLDYRFISGSGADNTVRAIAVQPNGQIVFGGDFTSYNGQSTYVDAGTVTHTVSRLARLNADGTLDTTFAMGTAAPSTVYDLVMQTDSTGATLTGILVGGSFTNFNSASPARPYLVRLTPAGAVDASFTTGTGPGAQVNCIAPQKDTGGNVNAILIGGNYGTVNGTARAAGLARLGPSGALDTTVTFNPTALRNGVIYSLAPLAGGRLLIAGDFSLIDGVAKTHLARLNADGSVEASFGPALNASVYAVHVQANGRIVILGGNFTTVNGQAINRIARLNSDGSIDATFNAGTGLSASLSFIVPQPDGKLLLGGNNTSFTYAGVSRTGLVRINADGSLDPTFNPGTFSSTVDAAVVQPDGQIVIGGNFTTLNGVTQGRLARLNGADGSLDSSFNIGSGCNSNVYALALHSDTGAVLVGGSFTSFTYGSTTTTRNRIARLTSTGALDTGFDAGGGPNSTVYRILSLEDGRALLRGNFTSVNSVANTGATARLSSTGAVDSSFALYGTPGIWSTYSLDPLVQADDGTIFSGGFGYLVAENRERIGLLHLVPATAPVITVQPQSVATTPGQTVNFAVTATGSAPLSYQWLKSGAPIAGATDSTLTLTHVQLTDIAGGYRVQVSNVAGTVTSNQTLLTGTGTAPVITTQPAAVTYGTAGGSVTLSVGATGGGLTYQWRRNGVPIPGATSPSIALTSLTAAQGGLYDVLVASGLSVTASNATRLDVGPAIYPNVLKQRANFAPRIEGAGIVNAVVLLADGRYYAAGNFLSVDGQTRIAVARFLAEGSLDPSFVPAPILGSSAAIYALAVQPADGRVLVGGTFGGVAGTSSRYLTRLNPDGTVDPGFNPAGRGPTGNVNAIVAQATGKILIGGDFTGYDGAAVGRVLRLNADGTIDPTFSSGSGFDGAVSVLIVQSDQRILAGGSFTSYNGTLSLRLARLGADGAPDTAFLNAMGGGFSGAVNALALQADNKIVAGGAFTLVNGQSRNYVARLGADGTLDAGFTTTGTGLNGTVQALAVQTDSNLVVAGQFTAFNGATSNRLARLTGTGALSSTLGTGAGFTGTVNAVAVRASDGLIVAGGSFSQYDNTGRDGLARLNADGTLDGAAASVRSPGTVNALVPAAGGKWLIGGTFNYVNGAPCANLARLKADGTTDASFAIGTGCNGTVYSVVEQGDGQFVVGGAFTQFNGVAANRIVRLNPGGGLDVTFAANAAASFNGTVYSLALQADGRIVAGGSFTSFGGTSINRVARLMAEGTLDSGFAPGTGLDSTAYKVLVQPDGRILAGGNFSTCNGASVNRVVRLTANGSFDGGPAVGPTTYSTIYSLVLQPDGKVVVGGSGRNSAGSTVAVLDRYLGDWSKDSSFATGVGFLGNRSVIMVAGLALQNDGKIVVVAGDTGIGGTVTYNRISVTNLVRLTSSGALDANFGAPLSTVTYTLPCPIAFADDGSLLAAFSRYGPGDRIVGGPILFEPSASPAILLQPSPATVQSGQTAVFNVVAAGAGRLRYQWKRNGVALVEDAQKTWGATVLPFLNVLDAQAADAADYSVTVSDDSGSVTSDSVRLNVQSAVPSLAPLALNVPVVQAGGVAYATVAASGSTPLGVQWQKNGANVAGGAPSHQPGSLQFVLQGVQPADAGNYSVTVTNSLGSISSNPARLFVDREANWQWHAPLPTSNDLYNVVVFNGEFVVSGTRNFCAGSANGINWNQGPRLAFSTSVYASGNGVHLFGGLDSCVGVSRDGTNWTLGYVGNPNAREVVNEIVFGNGLFVAVCSSGRIFTSPDGLAWTERASGTNEYLFEATYGNGTFLVSSAHGRLFRSSDGITWTQQASSPSDTTWLLRCLNGVFYFGTARGELFTSADGLTWTPRSTGVASTLHDMKYAAGTYVIVGFDGTILTSPDGIAWTVRPSGVTDDLSGVAYANGTWVAVSGNNNTILSSTDGGARWTNRTTMVTSQNLGALAVNGSASVVVVGTGGTILRSTTGDYTWMGQSSGVSSQLNDVAYGAGVYVAVGNGGTVRRSTNDGVSWSSTTGVPSLNPYLYFVDYLNGQFVVAGTGGTLLTSSNGSSWTSPTSGTANQLNGVAYGLVGGNGTYVAVGTSGTILTSPDSVTWTARASGTVATLNEVAFANGRFMAVGNAGMILTSPDGITWTACGFNPIASYLHVAVIAAGSNALFVVSGAEGGLYVSADGLDWSGRLTGVTSSGFSEVAAFNGRLYGVGWSGAIVSASLAPQIAIQPQSQVATAGGSTTFRVLGAGTPFAVSYQWRRNGSAIAGATNPSLTLTNVQAADGAFTYDVVLTNSAGAVTSTGATLNQPPVIVDQPISRRAVLGGEALFRVAATGASPLGYQWKKGGVDLAGATTADLTLDNLQAGQAGIYTVVVNSPAGPTTSAAAALTLLTPDPIFWQQFTEWSAEQSPGRTVHDGAGGVYMPWTTSSRGIDMLGGRQSGVLVRLRESDGSVDPAFHLDRRIQRVEFVVVLPGGQLLLAAGVGDASTVVRVTNTGAIDGTFAAPLFARGPRFLTLLSDGKVLVATSGGGSANAASGWLSLNEAGVYRLNSDGSFDATFTPVVHSALDTVFAPPAVDATGRIYLAGTFTTLNGTSRRGLARVSSTGVLDTAFANPSTLPAGFTTWQARGIALQSNGQVVVTGGFFHSSRGSSSDLIVAIRFNSDGTYDSTFAQPLRSAAGLDSAVSGWVRAMVMLSDDKFLGVADRVVRFNADGTVDSTFTSRSLANECFWVSRGADGRIFVPGALSVRGQAIAQPLWGNGVATFGADGTPDFSFQTGGWGRAVYPTNAQVLSDNRVWVAGTFNRLGATPLPALAQFTSAGVLSPTQAALVSPRGWVSLPSAEVADAGGDKVFALWGDSVGPAPFTLFQRLTADGTVDATFTPQLPAGYALSSASIYASPGGKVLLAQASISYLAALRGETGDALLRLTASGASDPGFNSSLSAMAVVERNASNAITLIRTAGIRVAQILPDGRTLLIVSAIDGTLRLLRLNENGSPDATFVSPSFGTITPSTGYTSSTTDPVTNTTGQFNISNYGRSELVLDALQTTDGKVYVAGRLNLSGSPRGLVRLNANGTVDPTFTGSGLENTASTAAQPYACALAQDAIGRVYVAGRFDRFNGTAVPGLFRLDSGGALDAAWSPGVVVMDYPQADVRLIAVQDKLYVCGTVGTAGDSFPGMYRLVTLNDIPTHPIISTQPAAKSNVAAGGSVTLSVSASGLGPFTYRWFHGASELSGATNATLSLANVTAASAGTYTVVVTNAYSSTTSAAAIVAVVPAGTSATHALSPPASGYVAGATVSLTNTFTYAAGVFNALSWSVLLPTGWTFAYDSGPSGAMRDTSAPGVITWTFTTVPASPITFTYALNVPAGQTGSVQLDAVATAQTDGPEFKLLAQPAPLTLTETAPHHADTDRNFRLNLIELTRVIELYNTRNGTIRTGCYVVQASTEDGFAPDPTRAGGTVVTLGRYHSADEDQNGKISLIELTRVIELYNYRSGTVRTGQYHVQSGTEDGYAPGP